MTTPAQPSLAVSELFEAGVASAELRAAPDPGLLYAAEAALCERFSAKRLADFTVGRLCARRVLADLGVHEFPLEIGRDRSPAWPPGIVGSISHTEGFGCAVAARIGSILGVGVDAETVGRVSPEIEPIVLTERERRDLRALSGLTRQRAATIIFSAKEAYYKCQFPLTRRWLDFTDIWLELATDDMQHGTFVVHPIRSVDTARETRPLRGRFRVSDDLALTGITCDTATYELVQAIRATADADAASPARIDSEARRSSRSDTVHDR